MKINTVIAKTASMTTYNVIQISEVIHTALKKPRFYTVMVFAVIVLVLDFI